MGVGVFARLQHTPEIRQMGTRELRTGSRSVPQCGGSETGSRSPGGSYLEMGGVCL